MEEDEACILSKAGLNNRCDKPANQVFHLSLKAKLEDAKSPKELIMEEDQYKVSNRYNSVAKNVNVKVSRRKVKLNGNLGSSASVKTNKYSIVIPDDESIESMSKDRTQNDTNISEQVVIEKESLEVVRKRKTCVSPDSSSAQYNSSLFENKQNTSLKKRKVSHHLSIPTQSVIPQADARVYRSSEDSSTTQKTVINSSGSQGSTLLDSVEPDTHLTGFAQYLGLQPIVKFRCFKCEETGFPSLNKLQEHQSACLKNLKVPLIPKPSQPHVSVDPSLSSTNFRISRKVFLCGSCGTYYENWNLFLHMREVHKRLICLYCLTMFSQIDMLSAHLSAKHGIVETVHATAEDLLNDCKGSCFLMCCDCDAIFTERDDFANHACVEKPRAGTTCQLCGMRNTHFLTCPRAGASGTATCTSSQTTTSRSTVTDSKPSPQTTVERTGASVTKYLIPVSSVQVPHRQTTGKKCRVAEDNQESDVDDDYDISNAASFCHVNIHEAPEKTTSVCSDLKSAGVCDKSATTLTKLITDTVPTHTESVHESDKTLNKTEDSPPVIEDSTSGKILRQKCDVKALVDDSTCDQDRDNALKQNSVQLNLPSPAAVNIDTPSPAAVNIDTPSPAAVNIDTPSPAAVNIDTPSPAAVNSDTPSPAAVNSDTLSPAAVNSDTPSPAAVNSDTPSPAAVNSDTPSPAAVNIDTPSPAAVNIDTPSPAAVNIDTPSPAEVNIDTPSPAAVNIDTPSPAAVNIDTPSPVTVDNDVSHSEELKPCSSEVAPSLEPEGNVKDLLPKSVEFDEKQVTSLPEDEQEASLSSDNVDLSTDKKHKENISINTDLFSTASEVIETELKLSSCDVSVITAASPDMQHLENAGTCNSSDPLETDDTESNSPISVNKLDSRSPVRLHQVEGTDLRANSVPDDDDDDDEDQAAGTGEPDVHDTQSLTRTYSVDSMSPLTDDTMDVKSPVKSYMADSNQSIKGEDVDSHSPRMGEGRVNSPILHQIGSNLPEMYAFGSKSLPPEEGGIDLDSSTQEEIFDKFSTSEITNPNKSPTTSPVVDTQSAEEIGIVDYKSPIRSGWSDDAKSPLMTELEDSTTSSLRIELNLSESVPSNEPSKSPEEFNDSKSPLSEELNTSIILHPLLPEIDSSKSPLRTPFLNDSSRSSSRASSPENRSTTPSTLDCPNTENSTDTSYLGPPPVAETENDLQISVFKREYISKQLVPLTPSVKNELYRPTTSCTENILRSNTDIGIKLQITCGTPVIIPKTTCEDYSDKERERTQVTPSPNSDIGDINAPLKEDEALFPAVDKHINNDGTTTNKSSTKSKKKKKRPSRGGKRLNRKTPQRGKKLSENVSESENSGPVQMQDDLSIKADETVEYIQLAGDDCVPIELHLEDALDALTIQVVMQESVKLSHDACVYCNHAKKIAVNGKQLALHLLAEHKFIPIYTKCENTDLSADDFPSKKPLELSGEEPTSEETEKFSLEKKALMDLYVQKLKTALPNLQDLFLNTDTYDSSDRTFSRPYDRTYECFHCHFVTVLHKDLYVHNRKMHQKTILLCIMCKSNFYSYSELLCHLCPGIYVPESSIKFRCHICSIDSLPSTFRLMVHLRKRHSVCDVCLETTDDQQKLSTHVWKHKLHHLCYRCGIAYRNKPDITKHLFWKHGTESVLCKKCLQKKWPHVYHFCIPPNAFVCEECNASFTRAVALKVHKRLHTGDFPHSCEECEEHFISKRLLERHREKHREVPEIEMQADEPDATGEESIFPVVNDEQHKSPTTISNVLNEMNVTNHVASHSIGDAAPPDDLTVTPTSVMVLNQSASKPPEKKVDVYDLPPLNLSSDSDDSEAEEIVKSTATTCAVDAASTTLENVIQPVEEDTQQPVEEDTQQPVPVVDGIWDNFQNYKANLEKRESQNTTTMSNAPILSSSVTGPNVLTNVMLDHDYCVADGEKGDPGTETVVQTPTCTSSVGPPEQKGCLLPPPVKTENENNGFDHDYCFNKNDGSGKDKDVEKGDVASLDVSANVDSSIKKQKSQKKKKRNASSSSSDSSSSSGSSSCSCGDNCSCSSSSSSSGSSSDSSDSDRSNTESRRRQIARKERRDKIRKKKGEDNSLVQEAPATNSAQEDQDDVNQVCPPEPEEKEVPILESDLDTDETETDEDFYDQHPQLLANKLMAEKRNQLLLLAAVAPVNVAPQPEPENITTPTEAVSSSRKKVKSKKRKKRQHGVEKSSDVKLKINLSTNYYDYQPSNPGFYKPVAESHTFNPIQSFSQTSKLPPAPSIQNVLESVGVSSAAESGSETDSKRLSKRRRMPKKFYGDSSDEDSSSHTKWSRKPSTLINPVPVPCPPPITFKNVNPLPIPEASQVGLQSTDLAVSEKSEEEDGAETESEQGDVKKSSSESSSDSDGEKEMEIHTDSDIEPPLVVETEPVQVVKKNENVYCYCQCPYDEVSEMIACDGKDCKIEWFHFECVGIMVPPKGKWFCPDCKKRMPTKNQHLS